MSGSDYGIRKTPDEHDINEEYSSDSPYEEEEDLDNDNSGGRLSSRTLSNFGHDIDPDLFDLHMERPMRLMSTETRFKNGTRRSLTFTNDQMRSIDRANRILLTKIIDARPACYATQEKQSTKNTARVLSAAAINRKKQQKLIDFENQILQRKIMKIATRQRRAAPPP